MIPAKPLIPADTKRCQAMKPGNGPFTLGGPIGDPRDGYRERCTTASRVVVVELVPGKDGRCGSMSLCASCHAVFVQDFPDQTRFKTRRLRRRP